VKTSFKFLYLMLFGILAFTGCTIIGIGSGRTITPSQVIIRETRAVSGFSGIDMGTIGKVVLSQGSAESVTISGSDNLVPLILTNVKDRILFIETTEDIRVRSFTREDLLTITIVVKDLSSLTLSGLGDLQMGSLTTPKLTLIMSGGGLLQVSQLATDELNVTLSGGGKVELAGEARQATVELSGAGEVNSPDLKIQTANVSLPGLGKCTLWVTEQLTGNISGAGNVSYYGNPKTDVTNTGLGSFKSLGSK
jgi:hypothetical protein